MRVANAVPNANERNPAERRRAMGTFRAGASRLQSQTPCRGIARERHVGCRGTPVAIARPVPFVLVSLLQMQRPCQTRTPGNPPSRTRRARNGNYPYNTHNERYTETFLFILYQVESSGTRPEPPLQAAASSGTPPETAAFVATTEVLDSSLSVVVP